MAEQVKPEDKWWVNKGALTPQERSAMTPEQQAERRVMLVGRRLASESGKLSAVRRKRMLQVMRQWFHGEVLREMAGEDHASPVYELRAWLRREFVTAVTRAFSGQGAAQVVERVIRAEVGKVIAGLSGGHSRNDHRGENALKAYIEQIVHEEVKKQLMASLTFEATVTGHVHQNAKGSRSVELLGPPAA